MSSSMSSASSAANSSSSQNTNRSNYSNPSGYSNNNNNNNSNLGSSSSQQKTGSSFGSGGSNNNPNSVNKPRYQNKQQINTHKNYAPSLSTSGGSYSSALSSNRSSTDQQQTQQNKNSSNTTSNSSSSSSSSGGGSNSNSSSSSNNNQVNKTQPVNTTLNNSNIARMDSKLKQDKQQTDGVYRNARFMHASNTMLGCPVLLRVKSNDTYHGVFVTFSPDFDVLLECCHKVDARAEILVCGRSLPKRHEVHARFFERENIVDMCAYEVDKDFALKGAAESNFTDSAIAAKLMPQDKDDSEFGKELEPFPFEDHHHHESDLDSEMMHSHLNGMHLHANETTTGGSSAAGWNAEDMLSLNEKKFGYKSKFNTEMCEYTIRVEKEDTDEYKRREEAAEKLALEIEADSNYKRNIDKELSEGEDEEEAFSAVVRQQSNAEPQQSEINNNSNKEYNYKDRKSVV